MQAIKKNLTYSINYGRNSLKKSGECKETKPEEDLYPVEELSQFPNKSGRMQGKGGSRRVCRIHECRNSLIKAGECKKKLGISGAEYFSRRESQFPNKSGRMQDTNLEFLNKKIKVAIP